MLEKWLSFVKVHERLLLTLVVALLAYILYGKYITHSEAELQMEAAARQKELAYANQASQAASQKVSGSQSLASEVDAQALATIKNLQKQIIEQQKKLAAQQSSDALLSDQGLVQRWATLEGLVSSDLLPNPSGGLIVSHPAAIKTLTDLERLPVLTGQVASLTKEVGVQEGQLEATRQLVDSLKQETSADKITLEKQEASCKADTKLAVAKAKKGHWIITGIAYVLGVMTGRRL